MEYDHLNYTPPSNTWKPHYQRMNNMNNGVPTGSQASDVGIATPPIPPLPKLHAPPPAPLTPPAPPKREDPPEDSSSTTDP